MAGSQIPALFVLAGLVNGATAADVPAPDLAAAQLRAVNHRFVHARLDPSGALAEALTHADFAGIGRDGAWIDRARFVAALRTSDPHAGARLDDLRVRQFGGVALVHGVAVAGDDGGPAQRVRFTDVHVWNGTGWQLVGVQESTLRDGIPEALQTGVVPAHEPWRGSDPGGGDDAVLHALNEGYVQAFRAADVAWYDAHLAADYVVVGGDGALRDRAAALFGFAQPTFANTMAAFPVGNVRVRRFGDVALIHAENAYTMKDGRTGVSRYTDIWHKRDGRWICIAAHITVHKAPGR